MQKAISSALTSFGGASTSGAIQYSSNQSAVILSDVIVCLRTKAEAALLAIAVLCF
jgi:hypothetical protein